MVYYDASGVTSDDKTVTVETSSSANIYINSAATSSYTKTADENIVRVIVQEGTAAPYIAIIEF